MNQTHKWEAPEGEIVIFHSEEDVKNFFCKLDIDPNDMEELGIILPLENPLDIDSDYMSEYDGRLSVLPVFDEDCDNCYLTKRDGIVFDMNKVTVNSDIYRDFPCIAYVHLSSSFDRFGPVKIKVAHVVPISEAHTVESLYQKEIEKYAEWNSKFEEYVKLEKARDEFMMMKALT